MVFAILTPWAELWFFSSATCISIFLKQILWIHKYLHVPGWMTCAKTSLFLSREARKSLFCRVATETGNKNAKNPDKKHITVVPTHPQRTSNFCKLFKHFLVWRKKSTKTNFVPFYLCTIRLTWHEIEIQHNFVRMIRKNSKLTRTGERIWENFNNALQPKSVYQILENAEREWRGRKKKISTIFLFGIPWMVNIDSIRHFSYWIQLVHLSKHLNR